MTVFGQLVIGPPGAGKTTYCDAMSQLLSANGRACAVVNLDPANDRLPFTPDVDVKELITLEDVMEHHKLGPNGGLLYCLEFLQTNMDWLVGKLAALAAEKKYFLVDCPGQVELFTHDDSLKTIVSEIQKRLDLRLCCVNLIDSHHCSDAAKFVSVCLTTLNVMLQMEMPQVNVLSKVDLIEKYGKLKFNPDFYADVLDLKYLTDSMSEDAFAKKHKELTEAITDVVERYGLVKVNQLRP